jgi:hypothetical protein
MLLARDPPTNFPKSSLPSSLPVISVSAHERINVYGTPNRPNKCPKHDESSNPVWNNPVCNNQASVALDTGGYDAMLMRERVSRSRSFDRADFEEGVVIAGSPNGFNAPVYDGLGVSIGSRGIAFFVVGELQRALAGRQASVDLKSGLYGSVPILPSQRIIDQLHTNPSLQSIVGSPPWVRFMGSSTSRMTRPRPVSSRVCRCCSASNPALGVPLTKEKSPQTLGMRHPNTAQSHLQRAGSPSCKASTFSRLNDRRLQVP